MVELVDNRFDAAFESDEVENVVVLVQVPFDVDGGAVVMTMQALALVALVANEVPAAENKIVLGDTHLETLRHGNPGRKREAGADASRNRSEDAPQAVSVFSRATPGVPPQPRSASWRRRRPAPLAWRTARNRTAC